MNRRTATPTSRDCDCGGFTLVELMVVLSLVVILGGLSVRPIRDVMDRNRIAGQINRFMGDLRFARSEAIRRGTAVTLCPSSDGSNCVATNVWHAGWVVFSDPGQTGKIATSDDVLRVQRSWQSGDTFLPSATVTSITYGRDGFSLNLPAAIVTIALHAASPSEHSTRCVAINRVGRAAVQISGVGACA